LDGSFKGLICDGSDNGSEVGLNNRRIDTQANEASLFGISGYTSALQCDAIGRGNGSCFLWMITTFFFLAANRMIQIRSFLACDCRLILSWRRALHDSSRGTYSSAILPPLRPSFSHKETSKTVAKKRVKKDSHIQIYPTLR
jgi:hypothetical protein